MHWLTPFVLGRAKVEVLMLRIQEDDAVASMLIQLRGMILGTALGPPADSLITL